MGLILVSEVCLATGVPSVSHSLPHSGSRQALRFCEGALHCLWGHSLLGHCLTPQPYRPHSPPFIPQNADTGARSWARGACACMCVHCVCSGACAVGKDSPHLGAPAAAPHTVILPGTQGTRVSSLPSPRASAPSHSPPSTRPAPSSFKAAHWSGHRGQQGGCGDSHLIPFPCASGLLILQPQQL